MINTLMGINLRIRKEIPQSYFNHGQLFWAHLGGIQKWFHPSRGRGGKYLAILTWRRRRGSILGYFWSNVHRVKTVFYNIQKDRPWWPSGLRRCVISLDWSTARLRSQGRILLAAKIYMIAIAPAITSYKFSANGIQYIVGCRGASELGVLF